MYLGARAHRYTNSHTSLSTDLRAERGREEDGSIKSPYESKFVGGAVIGALRATLTKRAAASANHFARYQRDGS